MSAVAEQEQQQKVTGTERMTYREALRLAMREELLPRFSKEDMPRPPASVQPAAPSTGAPTRRSNLAATGPRRRHEMAANSSTMTGVSLADPKLFRQSCYVDGAWVNARGGATINVDNPATGEIVGTVPKFGAVETRDAIEAANRAYPEWRKKTAKERAAVLRRWFELMIANTEDLAKLMTTEQGKPLVESRG